jgi:hypothetical protein
VRSNAVLAVERTAANPRTFTPACELITRLRASTGPSDKDAVQCCVRTHPSCERTHLHKTATFLLRASTARMRASTDPLQRRSALLRSNAPSLRSNALEKNCHILAAVLTNVLTCARTHLCCLHQHTRFFYLFDFLYLFIVSACF